MKRIIILLCFFCALTTQAQTIKSVLNEIEKNSLTLKATLQDGCAEVAEAESRNALSAPEVEYIPQWTRGTKGIAETEFSVTQGFDFPSLYASRSKTAKVQATLSNAQYMVERRNVLWEAEQLCIDLVRLNKQRNMLKERLQISEDLHNTYNKKLEVGDATVLEINKIHLDCISRSAELEQVEAKRHEIGHQLMALNAGKRLALDSIDYDAPHLDVDFKAMVEQRLQSDVEILAAEKEVSLAERELKEARQSWLPSVSLGYRGIMSDEGKMHGMIVGMAFPLYSNSKQTKASRAKIEAATLRKQQKGLDIANGMMARTKDYANYLKAMKVYDLDLLNQSLDLLHRAVDAGEMSIIEYYTEAERIYEQWQAYFDLEHDCQMIHAELHVNEL